MSDPIDPTRGTTDSDPEIPPDLRPQLAQWSAPAPTAAETDALLRRLELPAGAGAGAWRQALRQRLVDHPISLLLTAQLRIIRTEIWAATALLLALGGLVTLLSDDRPAAAFYLVIFAPVVAAGGIAFLYGPDADSARELTTALPVSAGLILLSRMLLLFGFNLLLALLISLLLTWLEPTLYLGAIISSWLAPMTFLSSLAFFLAVFTGSSEGGMLFSLALWMWQALLNQADGLIWAAFWPNLMTPAAQPLLWLAALLLAGLSFWQMNRDETWLGRHS